jgi:hypothetical protein
MSNSTRITVFVAQELWEKLTRYTTAIGVSREFLLSSTLESELGYLQKLAPNGPKASRWFSALTHARPNRKRLNLSLNKKVAAKLRNLCKEKGITRDQFISEYISFLVEGDPAGSCTSPLLKIRAIIDDPRWEYASNRDSNPYDDLHLSEEDADKLVIAVREMLSGSGKSHESDAVN